MPMSLPVLSIEGRDNLSTTGSFGVMLDIILTLAERFREQGYELYMVGGAVRDLLLHHDTVADADLATNARPDEVKRLAAPTHPLAIVTVGEQFGTVRLHYRRPRTVSDSTATAGSSAELTDH